MGLLYTCTKRLKNGLTACEAPLHLLARVLISFAAASLIYIATHAAQYSSCLKF